MGTKPDKVVVAIEELRQTHGVDVFCLNEATSEVQRLLERSGYKTVYIARSDHHGVMIASRHVIKNSRHYELVETMRNGSPHRTPILMADFMHKKRKITVATTHLTYFGPREFLRRDKEKHEILNYIPPNNTVFGGDLNTVIFPFVKWTLKHQGLKSRVKGKTWRLEIGRHKLPISMQLDHVFTTRDIASITKAEILPFQVISDHKPILTTIL